jgi:hypothetical protein
MYLRTILVIIISFLSLVINAQNFYVFIVYDDLDSTRFSQIHQKNSHELLYHTKRWAEYSELDYRVYKYSKHTLSKGSLIGKIRSLDVGSDDVLWFAYFGIGGKRDFNSFPSIDSSLTQDNIHKILLSKQARLTINMFDCIRQSYNHYDKNVSPFCPPNYYNYHHLFRFSKGDLKITGTSNTYLSGIGDTQYGGLFTMSFLNSLKQTCYEDIAFWNDVIKATKKKMGRIDIGSTKKQELLCKMNVFPTKKEKENCLEVEEEDTKEFIVALIIESYKQENKEIFITTSDLKTCNGELVGSRDLIIGECLMIDDYD